jgi:hypothetical protein
LSRREREGDGEEGWRILLSLTSEFSQATGPSPAAAVNVLMGFETQFMSSETVSREDEQALAVTYAVPPEALSPVPLQPSTTEAVTTAPSATKSCPAIVLVHPTTVCWAMGPSFLTLSRTNAERAITCESLLITSAASPSSCGLQNQPETTGVCRRGWIPIWSGGEKRVKRWFSAEVEQGCVVAGLVIGLAMLGGLIMRAVEDVRPVAEGVCVPFWWCLEYLLWKWHESLGD